MITCNKCGVGKPAADYYASNPRRCKRCVCDETRLNRLNNREHYAAYDRNRSNLPHRQDALRLADKKRYARDTVKCAARRAALYAVRSGKIEKRPCERCGDANSQAHHEDYGRPLDVRWLCHRCHMAMHVQERLA